MQSITNKPSSIIWRFPYVLTRCHVWYFLIVAVCIPTRSELFAFPWGHNIEDILNKNVDMIVLNVAGRMLGSFVFEFCDNFLEFSFEESTQSIILSPSNLDDSSTNSNKASDDCYNQVMHKLHGEALTAFWGLVVGGIIVIFVAWYFFIRSNIIFYTAGIFFLTNGPVSLLKATSES
jgi:hypothetical protein